MQHHALRRRPPQNRVARAYNRKNTAPIKRPAGGRWINRRPQPTGHQARSAPDDRRESQVGAQPGNHRQCRHTKAPARRAARRKDQRQPRNLPADFTRARLNPLVFAVQIQRMPADAEIVLPGTGSRRSCFAALRFGLKTQSPPGQPMHHMVVVRAFVQLGTAAPVDSKRWRTECPYPNRGERGRQWPGRYRLLRPAADGRRLLR